MLRLERRIEWMVPFAEKLHEILDELHAKIELLENENKNLKELISYIKSEEQNGNQGEDDIIEGI